MQFEKENEAFEHFRQQDYVSAERLFRELYDEATTIDIKGNRKQNLASCLAAQGKDKEALEMLKDVPQIETSDIANIYTLALCFVRVSDFDAAIESFARLTLNKDSPLAAHEELYQLLGPFLDLLAFCINSTDHWKRHHKNCNIVESVLVKFEELIKDQQNNEQQYIWQRNLAHIMFMADKLYASCSRLYYDLLLTPQTESTSVSRRDHVSYANVEPSVLRNLCVCYILTGRNRDAEQLIKEIESDLGEDQTTDDADLSLSLYSAGNGTNLMAPSLMQPAHAGSAHNTTEPLVHVNLAVGTLYCVKNNYEFGIRRIIETLDPIEKKLTTFGWSQAKRCILSLIDKHCRQLICAQDDLLDRIVQFLMQCEASGILVPANQMLIQLPHDGRNSVTYEARHLRAILLDVIHD